MMDITAQYNRSSFIDFLSTHFLPDDFETVQEKITPEKPASYIKNTVKLGSCPSLDLSVYEFVHSSHHDPRVSLSREAFTILGHYDNTASNALAVFYNKDSAAWRLSLITSEYSLGKTSVQVKRGFSNPRRYSYLLGEGCKQHTPEEMLVTKGKVGAIEDLSSRFAIDVVTKQFYKEIFDWYQWALSGEAAAAYPNGSNEEHLIRLITRLMFVWFIKQKGLIPEDIFDSKELAYTLKDFDPLSEKSGNYYNAILQNLFFATLNRPITDREFASGADSGFRGKNDHYGIKTLYRDDNKETWFKKPNKEIIELFKRVPFLNGGLFECLDKEDEKNGKILYFDGFSRDRNRRKRAYNFSGLGIFCNKLISFLLADNKGFITSS